MEHVFLESLGLNWQTRAPLLLRPNDRPELGPPRLAHLKAADYTRCKYITEEQFGSYFKFAFVRNPWDRLISMYRHHGLPERMEFKSFLMKTFMNDLWKKSHWWVGPQYEFVCNPHGELMVDFVGKFENLQADFDRVCRSVGLPLRKLPHVNRGAKPEAHWPSTGVILRRPRVAVREVISRLKRKPPVGVGSHTAYYDEESMQLVAELYRKDIELFGYRFEGDAPLDEERAPGPARIGWDTPSRW